MKTKIMGIINITPDSFSGDGLIKGSDPVQSAVEQAKKFISQGADILDIGAESTRPGAALVNEKEELNRLIPTIQEIRKSNPDVIISVDTYKAKVAEAAIQAGADWINDVWGFKADPDIKHVAAQYQTPSVLMHNRSTPNNTQIKENLGGRYINVEYKDLINDIKNELIESVNIAIEAGLPKEKIILDPGIGFGKTVQQNLQIMKNLNQFVSMDFPILLGPSRKSFIGYTLNLSPDERVEGTIAAAVIGTLQGVQIIRVHDVQAVFRAINFTDAVINS